MTTNKTTFKPEEIENHLADEQTPSATLHHVATSIAPHADHYQAIADHPNASHATLTHILKNRPKVKSGEIDTVLGSIAGHPNAPREALEEHVSSAIEEDRLDGEHVSSLFHPAFDPEKRKAIVNERLHLNPANKESGFYKRWEQKDIAKSLFGSAHHHTVDDVSKAINHPLAEVAVAAASSPHATPEHEQHLVARGDIDAADMSNLLEKQTLHPDTLSALHNAKWDESDQWNKSHLHSKIAAHPNTPDSVVAKMAKSQDTDVAAGAFSNPKFPAEKAVAEAKKGNKAAIQGALSRHDLSAEHIKEIDSSIAGDLNWTQKRHIADILAHKNTPPEILKARADESTEFARKILGNQEVPEEILKHLVMHKNKSVAIDALRHHSVTEGVVTHAASRKAKDVAAAAAAHRLAPKSIKNEKAASNPLAAAATIKTADSPDEIASYFDHHDDHPEVTSAAIKNKNTPISVIDKIARKHKGTSDDDKTTLKGLLAHPNLSPAAALHLSDKHPQALSKLSPEDLTRKLGDWEDKHSNGSANDSHITSAVNSAIANENLTPEVAKHIVSKHMAIMGSALAKKIHERPDVFTKEVIKAGLDVPHEISDQANVFEFAASPHLTADDISEQITKHGRANSSDEGGHHSISILGGLTKNPNATREQLNQILNTADISHDDRYSVDDRAMAFEHPNFHNDDMLSGALNPDSPIHHGLGRSANHSLARAVSEQLRDRGLLDEFASKTTSDKHLSKVLAHAFPSYERHNSDGLENALKSAFSNPSEEVQLEAAKHLEGGSPGSAIEKVADTLLDHPNEGVRETAFGAMSKPKQAEFIQKYGLNSAAAIEKLDAASMKDFKVEPHHEYMAREAILKNPNATHEHLQQLIDHSPDSAVEVASKLGDLSTHQAMRKFPGSLDHSPGDRVISALMDAHPGNTDILRYAADHIRSPDLIRKGLDHALEQNGQGAHWLLHNPNFKKEHYDKLSKLKGPEYEGVMRSLASHSKTPVSLLQHVLGHYPKLAVNVADHDKAASAKVLKTLLETKDHEVLATLASNQKVPAGVREELLKNPKVLMMAKPHQITADHIDEALAQGGSDPSFEASVARLNKASPSTIEKITEGAFSRLNDGNAETNNFDNDILQAASAHKGLSHKLQEKLAMHDPELAAGLLSNNHIEVDPALIASAMEKHGPKGSKGIKKQLLESYLRSRKSYGGGVQDASIADRLVDSYNPAIDPPSHYAALIKQNEMVGEHHIRSIYGKFMDHYAANGTSQDPDEVASLLGHIAKKAPSDIQGELVKNPETHLSLLENHNLDKAHVGTIQDELVKHVANAKDTSERLHAGTVAKSFVENKAVKTENVDALWKAVSKIDGAATPEVASELANSKKISPTTASELLDHGQTNVLSNPKLPTEKLASILSQHAQSATSTHVKMFEKAAANPAFSLSAPGMPDYKSMHIMNRNAIFRTLPENLNARSEDLDALINDLDAHSGYLKHFSATAIKNPGLSKKSAKLLMDNNYVSEKDALHSPSLGGELFRSKTHTFPQNLTTLDPKLATNEAHYRPNEDKIRSLTDLIPEGGHISYEDLLKKSPSLANNPAIKEVFKADKQQRATKESVEKYLSEMPSKKFHVSYSNWTGMQRHNPREPQLVIQINNHEDHDKSLNEEREIGNLYRFVQQGSFHSGHPVTPQTQGWARVDTSHPEHWFIEEVQSDLGSGLAKEIEQIRKEGKSDALDERGVDPDSAGAVVNKLTGVIEGWDRASINHTIALAKAHGVKRVFIHSGLTKTRMNKTDSSKVTNKYDKLYNRMTQAMGFKPVSYEDYAGHNPDSPLKGQQIWALDIDEGPKNKKK